jgi:hypothetical protein
MAERPYSRYTRASTWAALFSQHLNTGYALVPLSATNNRIAVIRCKDANDGLGVLTGARQETDPLYYGTRHGERLRHKIGARLLSDGIERFYLPGTLWEGEQKASG